MALPGSQKTIRLRHLDQGLPPPSLLEILEFVLHKAIRAPEKRTTRRAPKNQPDRQLSERRVRLPVATTRRQARRLLVQGYEVLDSRHPQFAHPEAASRHRQIQTCRSLRRRLRLP